VKGRLPHTTLQHIILFVLHSCAVNTQTWPWMGARARLKSSFDCTANMVTQAARIICTAMKNYGLILADNGEFESEPPLL